MGDLSRREFLAAGVAAAALSKLPTFAPDGLQRIGIQLYTVRSLLDKDLEGTLAALAKIGYREVELAGLAGHTSAAFKAALDAARLDAVSAHYSLEELTKDFTRVEAEADELEIEYLVCAWIDAPMRTSIADYERIAKQLNALGVKAKNNGLKFAFHNHSSELQKIGGKVPYDVLLEQTDSKLVSMEMDVYWVVDGGGSPRRYFARYPGRFVALHVKDRSKDGKMVDVGKGTIDFPHIFANADKAGVKHYFVEHDEPASPLDFAQASFRYLDHVKIPTPGRRG